MGIEPTISADERLQTYALDRAATGTCELHCYRDYSRDNRNQVTVNDMEKVKVKQSRNRPSMVQRVPGGLSSQIS